MQSSPASRTRTTSMRLRSTSADLHHETSRRECDKLEFESFLWPCQAVFWFFLRRLTFYLISVGQTHICRLSFDLSISSFQVLSGKIFEPVHRTLLECWYNPRFSLDESKLPAEFVPQVLLNVDFDQLVDTTGLPGSALIPTARVKTVITPPTAGALPVNSPIDCVLPGTSSSLPVRISFSGKVGNISSRWGYQTTELWSKGVPFHTVHPQTHTEEGRKFETGDRRKCGFS